MQTTSFPEHHQTLLRFARKHRERTLTTPRGLDFSSNDYLAFSSSPRIKNAIRAAIDRGVSIGASASRLLRGHHEAFDELEKTAAHFFGSDKALYMANGYAANVAILSTLPKRGDLVLYDERVHASMLDGIKAGAAASHQIKHNDLEAIDQTICAWRKKGGKGHPWIAVESLYSMDGDQAPLSALYDIANRHDGVLVIDDAHGTGVFGPQGRGLAHFLEAKENVIVMHTCGKALGLSGAFICCNDLFYRYLINRARIFIFSTAPSPLLAVGVHEALNMLMEEPAHRDRLATLYHFANQQFATFFGIQGTGSQILPLIVGKNARAVRIADQIQSLGYDVRAIRPPTVAEGTARLRIVITLHANEAEIARLFSLLSQLLKADLS